MEEKKCPVCGAVGLQEHATRRYPFHYHGHKTLLTVHGAWCPVCDEMLVCDEHGDYMEAQMDSFKNEIDAIAPDFIQKTRLKLGMSLAEAGEVFGGGAKSFEKYEKGEKEIPHALMALLKILDAHPDLVEEIWIKADGRPADDQQ